MSVTGPKSVAGRGAGTSYFGFHPPVSNSPNALPPSGPTSWNPSGVKAVSSQIECGFYFPCGLSCIVKRLRNARDLARLAALQSAVDLPRISAGEHDECALAHVSETHRITPAVHPSRNG
jgi:hypothetical protein